MFSSMNLRWLALARADIVASAPSCLLPDGNQRCFQAEGVLLRASVLSELGGDPAPVPENGDGVLIHLAVNRAHAGEVDLADEVDLGGLLGVVGAALHLEFVDSVFVVALDCEEVSLAGLGWAGHVGERTYMRRTPDGSSPVCHEDVFGVFEAVRAGA